MKKITDPNQKWFMSRKLWIITGIVIVIIGIPLVWLHNLYPTTSPFKTIAYMNYHRTHPHADVTKRTVGFAPYWQLGKLQNIRLDLLTDVIYFSLTVDGQGNLATKNSKGEADLGWTAWNKAPANDLLAKTQIMGGRTGLS